MLHHAKDWHIPSIRPLDIPAAKRPMRLCLQQGCMRSPSSKGLARQVHCAEKWDCPLNSVLPAARVGVGAGCVRQSCPDEPGQPGQRRRAGLRARTRQVPCPNFTPKLYSTSKPNRNPNSSVASQTSYDLLPCWTVGQSWVPRQPTRVWNMQGYMLICWVMTALCRGPHRRDKLVRRGRGRGRGRGGRAAGSAPSGSMGSAAMCSPPLGSSGDLGHGSQTAAVGCMPARCAT